MNMAPVTFNLFIVGDFIVVSLISRPRCLKTGVRCVCVCVVRQLRVHIKLLSVTLLASSIVSNLLCVHSVSHTLHYFYPSAQ